MQDNTRIITAIYQILKANGSNETLSADLEIQPGEAARWEQKLRAQSDTFNQLHYDFHSMNRSNHSVDDLDLALKLNLQEAFDLNNPLHARLLESRQCDWSDLDEDFNYQEWLESYVFSSEDSDMDEMVNLSI